jgi:hypothetical protein
VLTNTAFATSVVVVVPVVLLALGAEARALDERTRPQRTLGLFLAGRIREAERLLESFPDATTDWSVEQRRTQWTSFRRAGGNSISLMSAVNAVPDAYTATITWALTITSLTLTEILNLVWLADHHPEAGDWSGLAWLSVTSIAMGMLLLLAVPVLRLLWFQIPSPENTEIPDSYYEVIERKFGLPANASKEERRRWISMMNERP